MKVLVDRRNVPRCVALVAENDGSSENRQKKTPAVYYLGGVTYGSSRTCQKRK